MRDEYDFSESTPNPFFSGLKKQVTLRLDPGVIDYFEQLAKEAEVPYQTLMSLYLKDCAAAGRRLDPEWVQRQLGGPTGRKD